MSESAEYVVQKITRVVVILHAGSGMAMAFTDKDGKDQLDYYLGIHEASPVIYDGPPNKEAS